MTDRCKVTVYSCCPVNVTPGSTAKPERAHQCHDLAVKDGLCLRHLRDKIRLLKR